MSDRDRCFYEGVVHAVADSENWQSRCWTWCDLRLDWADRASELGKMTKDSTWPTNEPVTCIGCIARME